MVIASALASRPAAALPAALSLATNAVGPFCTETQVVMQCTLTQRHWQSDTGMARLRSWSVADRAASHHSQQAQGNADTTQTRYMPMQMVAVAAETP